MSPGNEYRIGRNENLFPPADFAVEIRSFSGPGDDQIHQIFFQRAREFMHIPSFPFDIPDTFLRKFVFQFHGHIVGAESGGFQYSDADVRGKLFLHIKSPGNGFYQILREIFPAFFQFPAGRSQFQPMVFTDKKRNPQQIFQIFYGFADHGRGKVILLCHTGIILVLAALQKNLYLLKGDVHNISVLHSRSPPKKGCGISRIPVPPDSRAV